MPFNQHSGGKKLCGDPDSPWCRLWGPTSPKMDCKLPWELARKMGSGMGFAEFDGTLFAHFKKSECKDVDERHSFAISHNPTQPDHTWPMYVVLHLFFVF